jgi:hypothetical protein
LATTVAGLKPYPNPKGKGKGKGKGEGEGKGKGNARQTSNDEIKQRRNQATAKTSNGKCGDPSLRSG